MWSAQDLAQARADAALHLVFRIDGAEPTRSQPGQTLPGARVLTRNRSTRHLAPGARIAVWVDSCRSGQRCPAGDDLRLSIETLRAGGCYAAFLEVLADHEEPPILRAVAGQIEPIAAAWCD